MKTFRPLVRLRPFSFLILCSLFLISCSVSSKISKSAKNTVLNATPLKTAHIGISIYDPETGKYLYNYQGDKYFVPASNTKIPTCYAAMKYLGDSLVGLRYGIQYFGEDKPDTIILLEPTGDPTFLHPEYKIQPVFEFLKNNKYSLDINKPFYYEKYFGSGWSWNDALESYMAARSFFPIYGNVVRFTVYNKADISITPSYFKKHNLSVIGTKDSVPNVTRGYNDNNFYFSKVYFGNPWEVRLPEKRNFEIPFLPKHNLIESLLADTLGKRQISYYSLGMPDPGPAGWAVSAILKSPRVIHSQPTDSLLKPMMHRSDNFFAEQSLLMVSNEHLGYMNDAKIIDTLLKTDFKDLPQKPRWADGSGLSRYNLFTPQDFVAILKKMKNEFGMERIKTIFPSGGEGTISSYYKAGSGYIFAKTGTLSGVVALSGFLYTKKGKLLIFSTLVNNHQATATEVRRAVEKFIEGLREY
jgi:serine-type D-Ala-D-Ala carboxypeptidase/endopeptidase (penicillin-binding protein 4)